MLSAVDLLRLALGDETLGELQEKYVRIANAIHGKSADDYYDLVVLVMMLTRDDLRSVDELYRLQVLWRCHVLPYSASMSCVQPDTQKSTEGAHQHLLDLERFMGEPVAVSPPSLDGHEDETSIL